MRSTNIVEEETHDPILKLGAHKNLGGAHEKNCGERPEAQQNSQDLLCLELLP